MNYYKIYLISEHAVSAVNFLWDEIIPVEDSKGVFYPDKERAYAVATVMARKLHVNLNLEGDVTNVPASDGLTVIVTTHHINGTSPKALERVLEASERLAPELAYCTNRNSSWKCSPALEWAIEKEVEAFTESLSLPTVED